MLPHLSHIESFAVDASLLRELGERLIGRAPIALGELIKNAYDADATTCVVEFGEDSVTVTDDGTGMSADDFQQHWMRIGTTHKVDTKVSPIGRPYTGSKGLGRLSVQFLANEMTLESTAEEASGSHVLAVIDWSTIVRGSTLDTVHVAWDTVQGAVAYPNKSPTGARIALTRLKSAWTAQQISELGREVWQLRSPFRRPSGARPQRSREDFNIELVAPAIADAREAFDEILKSLFENWKARITGSLEDGRTGGSASISVEFKADYPDKGAPSETYRESVRVPLRAVQATSKPVVDRVKFQILVFRPQGRQPGVPVDQLREYLKSFGNVSLYDAGFRLPYYGASPAYSGQDWLGVAVDQGRRLSSSDLLPPRLRTQNLFMQDLPAPGRIFGAVDIDTNRERAIAELANASPGEWLELQPGRDRLQDNVAMAQLRDLVRFSLDYYANRHRARALHLAEEARAQEPASKKFGRAAAVLERARSEMPARVYRTLKQEIGEARQAASAEELVVDRRAALLGPLATAGMTALALNHEVSREVQFLAVVASKLRDIASAHDLPELASVAEEFEGAQVRLKALQGLFAPLASEADSQATERVPVRVVVEGVVDAMRPLMPGISTAYSGIPRSLHFPLGAHAEWSALLQNVLANSWNAMLDVPVAEIAVTAGKDAKHVREWLRVSDTGIGLGVPLDQSDQLFEPLARRLKIDPAKRSIAIGGQGLGLAIVRMIAHRRSARVRFVEPDEGFSTTLEVSWKGERA
jgi:signal transduction histidine kinase